MKALKSICELLSHPGRLSLPSFNILMERKHSAVKETGRLHIYRLSLVGLVRGHGGVREVKHPKWSTYEDKAAFSQCGPGRPATRRVLTCKSIKRRVNFVVSELS